MIGRCGNHDFGKPACPGDGIRKLIEELRAEPDIYGSLTPTDATTYQRALKELGFDLGKAGVDGVWGAKSNAALIEFQGQQGMPRTGRFDAATASKLAHARHDKREAAAKSRVAEEAPKPRAANTTPRTMPPTTERVGASSNDYGSSGRPSASR